MRPGHWDLTVGCDTCGHRVDIGGHFPPEMTEEEWVEQMSGPVATCSRCGSAMTVWLGPEEEEE